jgi:hypothetical protein
MCNYQGYEFGAGYLDSVCIDGVLFDADNCDDDGNLYEPMQEIPCPICHRAEAIEYWANQNRFGGMTYKKAMATACSLVNDIRANRGLEERRTYKHLEPTP